MKNYFLLAVITLLVCHASSSFSANIIVGKFFISDTANTNPVEVKPDVMESAVTGLQKALIKQIKEEGKLKPVDVCAPGDFELIGTFTKIDSRVGKYRKFPFAHTLTGRVYRIAVEGQLVDCKTREVIEDFDKGKENDDFDVAIQDLARYIVGKIGR